MARRERTSRRQGYYGPSDLDLTVGAVALAVILVGVVACLAVIARMG